MPKLEPYDKRADYSYCLGLYPCHALLDSRPGAVQRLLLHPDGLGSEGVEKLRGRCAELGVREEMAERVLKRESKKDNCFAALVFEKYQLALDPEADHAVFCQISDGGNLGTALRSLLGFGIRDVAVIRPCVDVFDPHVLRSSMGAFFKMRVAVFENFEEYREKYEQRTFYPFMLDGAITLPEAVARKQEPYSLIFGNEATGLPPAFAKIGQSVFIPQSREIDSLNLGVSVSIGAYAFTNGGKSNG